MANALEIGEIPPAIWDALTSEEQQVFFLVDNALRGRDDVAAMRQRLDALHETERRLAHDP